MNRPRRLRAILGLTMALGALGMGGGSASAHNPSASMACQGEQDPQPILQVDLAQYNGTNHVTITIDGVAPPVVDQDFGNAYAITLDAGGPFKAHTAQVVVTAHDDPTGSKGWTVTYDLSAPACQVKEPPKGALRLSINGPCGDPMYRVTYRNTTGHAAQATFKRKRGGDGSWVTSHYTIAAHTTWRTAYKWVKGGSLMTATLGTKRIQERSAPGGWYGACPK